MAIDVLPARRARMLSPFAVFRRARERAAADRWLAERTHSFAPSDAVRRRIAELASPRERTRLAKSLLGAVRDAGRRPGLSASPLNRRAVAECADELTELARRLSALDRPVNPRGVVLVLRLLTDGGSPLYGHDRSPVLAAETARIRAALACSSQRVHAESHQQGPQTDASREDADALVGDPQDAHAHTIPSALEGR